MPVPEPFYGNETQPQDRLAAAVGSVAAAAGGGGGHASGGSNTASSHSNLEAGGPRAVSVVVSMATTTASVYQWSAWDICEAYAKSKVCPPCVHDFVFLGVSVVFLRVVLGDIV